MLSKNVVNEIRRVINGKREDVISSISEFFSEIERCIPEFSIIAVDRDLDEIIYGGDYVDAEEAKIASNNKIEMSGGVVNINTV